jgi:ABC-type branched-subunit amino acid transport system ATPase component
MTCLHNMLASIPTAKAGFLSMFWKFPPELVERAEELLRFVGLNEKRHLDAGELSFGQQKLLELAMALMAEPRLLLLDEPTAGINPTLINGLIDRLRDANQRFGVTLLVIEHNIRVVTSLAQRIHCLAHGKLLAEGTPEEIVADPRVIEAYLGG